LESRLHIYPDRHPWILHNRKTWLLVTTIIFFGVITLAVKAYTVDGIWTMGVVVSWSMAILSLFLSGLFGIDPLPIFAVAFFSFMFCGLMRVFSFAQKHF
jgi:uncharacterized membrane protein